MFSGRVRPRPGVVGADLFVHCCSGCRCWRCRAQRLCWYIERHISLDGDSHCPVAEAMVLALVGDDAMAMQRVEQVKRQVIADRNRFWDELHKELRSPVPV